MRNILYILLPLFLIAAAGCSSDEKEIQEKEITDVPPSVKASESTMKMVQLSDKEASELKIKTVQVSEDIRDYLVIAPGKIMPAPDHVSLVSAPVDGRITSLNVFEGEKVKQGQIIMTIESLTFGNLVADYLQALSEKQYQENKLERIKQLVEKKISSENELDRVKSDFQRAAAALKSSYAKLRALGVLKSDIARLENSEDINPELKIRAPIEGMIDRRMVELGQSVNAYDKLYRIIDKTHILVKGYVSPEDGQELRVGDTATVMLRDNPGRRLRGAINSINPGLDEENRSVVVNLVLPTQNGWPKPGENVRLQIEAASPQEVIAIPVDAITYDGNTPVVFVKKNAKLYEQRALEGTDIRDKYVFVKQGLKSGEEIAVSQVFSLKALARYEQFSE